MALGRAAHRVLEQAHQGKFNGSVQTRPAVEASWDEVLETEWKRMAEEAPFTEPPRPDRWPGYQRVRVRTIRMAMERAAGQHRSPQAVEPIRTVRIERSLVSRDGAVVGRPDRVEVDGDSARVVDVKTGRRSSPIASEAERRQLLIYAYLWHEESGVWPQSGSIETRDGGGLEVSLDSSEAIEIVREAVDARNRANEEIEGGASWSILGRPSTDTCRHCVFRALCPAYWSIATPTDRYTQDVKGTIEAIDNAGGVTVRVEAGTVVQDKVRIRSVASSVDEMSLDRTVSFQDLVPVSGTEELSTFWESDYWVWSS